MSATERDFSDFYAGDNVYELADGLIPKVAEYWNVTLEGEANADQLQSILNGVRLEKELRSNPGITFIPLEAKIAMIERAGTQKALDRSLRTPEITATQAATRYIIPSSVPNWVDRGVNVLLTKPPKPVELTAGIRVMNKPTEKTNANVIALEAELGREPTEAEYMAHIAMPKLVSAGFDVRISSYKTDSLDVIAAQMMLRFPELRKERLALVTNANAGLIKAIQFRDAARKLDPDFDARAWDPQIFTITDRFLLDTSAEQKSDPKEFQKVDPAFTQMLLLPKKIIETGLAA